MVKLLPIMGVVFVTYLIMGLVMPVLPVYVQQRLGLDAFTIGIVSGAPFAAAVLARMIAGNFADRRGSKQGMLVGL